MLTFFKSRVLLHTGNKVPQVESFVTFDALVRYFASVVYAKRQTDHCKAHSHQQKQDHHHVKAPVQSAHKFGENWTKKTGLFCANLIAFARVCNSKNNKGHLACFRFCFNLLLQNWSILLYTLHALQLWWQINIDLSSHNQLFNNRQML